MAGMKPWVRTTGWQAARAIDAITTAAMDAERRTGRAMERRRGADRIILAMSPLTLWCVAAITTPTMCRCG
ncbi:hypothetical protein GCM10011505_10210 [Tistrella bauzanensis]|uniref:Uncharacterized protein n=1 Tax=Tistrella bauzanensis TaxID=657419 RepID=A0ABQ1ICJ1_9PROT|nr:hypothetical protein GCM10011505_10210 [Tistrella bauzanensis]